jgi:small subunit ribosomal protein S1
MNEPEDFASLFASSHQAKRLARGQSVEGIIVQIGAEVALVDVGAKSEAIVDVAQLTDADGVLEVKVGDRIQATVVSTANGVTLSRKLTRRAATDRHIESAYEAGLPVEGTVQAVVKGGYEVRVGQTRAFCPFSQIDTARTADPNAHVGHAYTFRIVEYGEGGRNVVLSRRALLEQEQQARAAELRAAIAPGAVLNGRVVSVRDFGAFVDLGAGVQGLLHVSEMSWARGSRAGASANLVAVGDEITVKVIRVDEDGGKIALSTKQLTDDPWSAVSAKYPTGSVQRGRVTRLAPFGAFVEMEPGVEALMPLGETGVARDADLARHLPVGTELQVMVLDTDTISRRMRVSCKAISDAEETAEVDAYNARSETPARGLGSLEQQLRDAMNPRRPR